MNNQPKRSTPILYSSTTLPEALTPFSDHIPSQLYHFLLEQYDQLSSEVYRLEHQTESLEEELEDARDELAEANSIIAALELENEKLRDDIANNSKKNG